MQLRRAAIEVLKIDNKEASNSKSGDLISRILDAQGGGGEDEKPASKPAGRGRAGKPAGRGRTAKSEPADEPAEEAAPAANGLGKMVDAVGKAVDESKEELSGKLEEILENQDHIMKQQFILFSLVTDIYKAVDEPDALEARLEEIEEEWNNQGNDG